MTEVAPAPGSAAEGNGSAVAPIHHWIDGAAFAGASGRTGAVFNPALGRQTGAVDLASVEEVDRAVQAAKKAFASWRSVSLARGWSGESDPTPWPIVSPGADANRLTARSGNLPSTNVPSPSVRVRAIT